MGKSTGFLEIDRVDETYAPAKERLAHYREFAIFPETVAVSEQAARCMDCGIPFCQNGCPVNNIIPDWNDWVYRDRWREAAEVLHSTNNFPEFTGRICPAPCEAACTLNINDEPVTIKAIERAIVDHAWDQGWIRPQPAAVASGRRVAVIGSGPAGLACAQQLARAGHEVTVYEKNERPGGLLRFGIPDFKMEKSLIDRRLEQMRAEGVNFVVNALVGGGDYPAAGLVEEYDAVVLSGGSEQPRDLPVPGRELPGVHFAMEFLPQQNRRNGSLPVATTDILASDKAVVVIGGGDTGSDCIGTSNRQGAAAVTQLELLPQPPAHENRFLVWPDWPLKLRTSTSHDEGCQREWSLQTKAFVGRERVEKIRLVRLQWQRDGDGAMRMEEIAGSEFDLPADLVLLAMGYLHPVHDGLLEALGVRFDGRGNVAASDGDYQTSVEKVFAAGDMRRGQSLVVWAIREGRQCARAVDGFLKGSSQLPR